MNRDDLRLIFEKALQRGADLFGLQLRPKPAFSTDPIDILRLAIRDLAARRPEVFFVQIGAHDGKTHDPLAPYVRALGWRGLLIEPQPGVFQQLKGNYAGVPGLLFENVAIGERDGTMTLHCFKNTSAANHASMLASTRKHYLQLNSDNARGELEIIEVPMRTLHAVLAKHGVKQVDLLQIDTEGHDFAILRSLDLGVLRPSIIHFENNFMNSRQRTECARLFAQQGYAALDLGIDTLAILQENDARFTERMKMSRVD